MLFSKNWSKWWRRFLDLAPDESPSAVDFLRQRYVEEMQQIERFKQHAEKMHYPQYREKFLRMAQEKSQHAERIGEKIVALGGAAAGRGGAALDGRKQLAIFGDGRSTKKIARQIACGSNSGVLNPRTRTSLKFLRQISREQDHHREELRGMLMRSDPFAQSFA